MLFKFKKLFFIFLFNSCLFLLLIIGIQNNSKKSEINLLVDKTIDLPVGFIIGTSFISGSILAGLLNLSFQEK